MADQERVVANNYERIDPVVPIFNHELAVLAGVGAGVGLVVSGASYVLSNYVFQAMMCQGEASGCTEAPVYATGIAMIIGALLALVALVQTRTYRPLLIVLSATIGMWGFSALTVGLPWYWQLIIPAILFAASYLAFAWLARIRAFVVALIVSIVIVAIMQLIVHG